VGFFVSIEMKGSKQQSNCLIIAHLNNKSSIFQRWSYSIVQWMGIVSARLLLKNSYKSITVCVATDASFQQIQNKIAVLSQNEPLDIILNVHGLPNGIFLYKNEFISIASFCALFHNHNLRLVYSTACYGKSHLQEWMKVNAQSAIGAEGINGNALTEYPFFLYYWKKGCSATKALQKATFKNMNPLQDFTARKIFGFRNVNSNKSILGNAFLLK